MDKKSKILLWVFAVLLVGAVAATYVRIMVWRDYVVEAQVDCDPYEEECFVWECDPESDVEGEACTGDPEADVWYFKVAKRNASRIPLCDPNVDENCQPMLCEKDEMECEEMLCTEDQLEAQYASSCVDPAVFAAENPIEEEAGCEEGDTECESAQEEATCEEGDMECLEAGLDTEAGAEVEAATQNEAETLETECREKDQTRCYGGKQLEGEETGSDSIENSSADDEMLVEPIIDDAINVE